MKWNANTGQVLMPCSLIPCSTVCIQQEEIPLSVYGIPVLKRCDCIPICVDAWPVCLFVTWFVCALKALHSLLILSWCWLLKLDHFCMLIVVK